MFRNSIKGIERIFKTNDYENLIIIVTGLPGTLKSSFIYNMISGHLEKHPKCIGLYATLEQSKESLIKNSKHLNIQICDRLHIADYNSTREMYKDEADPADYLELTERLIEATKEEHGENFICFALDSLNALYTLLESESSLEHRNRMFHFFKLLRNNGLTSFLIKEYPRHSDPDDKENYLADGIFELGVRETLEGKKRYIEVIKMRQNEHDMRQYILDVSKDGIAIIGPSVDDLKL